MTAVAFDRVTIALGQRTVLRDAAFTIRDDEFVAVLGPNGAGKTTLMRAILGLVRPQRGTITVLGAPPRRAVARIGYMPQTRAGIRARLSGWEFVASAWRGARFGLPLAGAAARREVGHALDLVGATALAPRRITDLSGGERQRLLLAQALLGRPRLLLLDEPLISLDPHHQQGVIDLVRRLQRELGLGVLFSAHEINPLIGTMDRVLYLGRGFAEIGTAEEVVTGPVLSRLYGAPIEVVRAAGRLFVVAGAVAAECQPHAHA